MVLEGMWSLPFVRLSECWIKYFRLSISIRPEVSLYIRVIKPNSSSHFQSVDGSEKCKRQLFFWLVVACHLQSAAMVAKKLLVDDKITARVKGICKVLKKHCLFRVLVKHFAFLKTSSKFCASSNLLCFLRGADWPTTNFLEMLLFSRNPIGKLCLSGQHCKGKIHPLEFFLESFSKSWNFLEELEQKLLLLRSRLHSSPVQRNENLGQFTLFTETIMHLDVVYPPKFYIIFVSSFSWVIHSSDNDLAIKMKWCLLHRNSCLLIVKVNYMGVKSSLEGCITDILKFFSTLRSFDSSHFPHSALTTGHCLDPAVLPIFL